MSSQDYPDVDIAAKDVSALPPASQPPGSDIAGGLADIHAGKTAETERVTKQTERQLDEDQQRMRKAYGATGLELEHLRPWDEQEQSRKFRTDPIEAFGSLGSVFGIVASAFTHAPMTNALNASAAAIHAIKEGNDDQYQRAHQAWKENIDLAMKRHTIMREQYQDASTLMINNLAAGQAKMQMLTAKYGDKQAQFLLEHGMSKELFELFDARNRTMMGAYEAANATTEQMIKDKLFKNMLDTNKSIQDPQQKMVADAAAFQTIYNKGKSLAESQAAVALLGKAAKEGRSPTADEWTKLQRDLSPYGQRSSQSSNLTIDRQNAQAADAYKAQLREEHPEMPEDEVQQKGAEHYAMLKSKATPMTANRQVDIKEKVNRINFAETIMDDIDKLMLKHNAITGIGGTMTRPLEVISNILGSNESDRKEFQRLVSEMQMIAPRILLDSKGRPLGVEAARINTEIAGLSPGDTSVNTIRAYRELRKQLEFLKKQNQDLIGGGGSEKPSAAGGGEWWKDPAAGAYK